MDKQTLSNYGWVIITVLVLAVMIALATPFGTYVKEGAKSALTGLFESSENALNTGLSEMGISVNKTQFNNNNGSNINYDHNAPELHPKGVIPEGGVYTTGGFKPSCDYCGFDTGTSKLCECDNFLDTYYYAWCPDCQGFKLCECDSPLEVDYCLCQCGGWTISGCPCGYISFTTEPKQTLIAGDNFPTTPKCGDTYAYGDFVYTYTYNLNVNNNYEWYYADLGWKVSINTNVTDKNQTTYGIILESINEVPVTDMYQTFYNCKFLTISPAIPKNIINLEFAFDGCTSLMVAPDLKHIDNEVYCCFAFNGCLALTSVPSLPNTNALDYTFYNCVALTDAPQIPNSVTSMYYTFDGCTSLTTAPTIPNSVTSMEYTFNCCTSLVVAPQIPSSVTSMYHTFDSCTSLTTAPTIPSSVTTMPYAFYGCTSLTGTICINTQYVKGNGYYGPFDNVFGNVDFSAQKITLTGLCTDDGLDKIGATGTNYCNGCNGCCRDDNVWKLDGVYKSEDGNYYIEFINSNELIYTHAYEYEQYENYDNHKINNSAIVLSGTQYTVSNDGKTLTSDTEKLIKGNYEKTTLSGKYKAENVNGSYCMCPCSGNTTSICFDFDNNTIEFISDCVDEGYGSCGGFISDTCYTMLSYEGKARVDCFVAMFTLKVSADKQTILALSDRTGEWITFTKTN